MDGSATPLILIELVLVFGSVLAFAWWQLRSVARDRRKAEAERIEQPRRDDASSPSERSVDSAGR